MELGLHIGAGIPGGMRRMKLYALSLCLQWPGTSLSFAAMARMLLVGIPNINTVSHTATGNDLAL